MRIDEMHVTPIAISDPPLRNAAGLHAPYALRTIVELRSDDGFSGLGEVPGSVSTTTALEEAREVIAGRDPFALQGIEQALTARFGAAGDDLRGQQPWDQRKLVHVFSAIEVACLDLIGHATGRPVVDLLGGRARDRVPFSAYLFFKHAGAGGELEFAADPLATGWAAARQAAALTPEGIVAQAHAMCEAFGFQSIKLKGGTLDPEVEVASIQALREAFGADVPLRLDPNAVWSEDTAIRWGRELEGTLEYYEDPTRGQQGMARVAAAVKLPLATKNVGDRFEISYKRGEDEDNIGWLDGRMVEVLEIDKNFTSNVIRVVCDDLKGIGGAVGHWTADSPTFPTSLGSGAMSPWDSSWSAAQKSYAKSHAGYWCDDNGFADPADADSYLISRWW